MVCWGGFCDSQRRLERTCERQHVVAPCWRWPVYNVSLRVTEHGVALATMLLDGRSYRLRSAGRSAPAASDPAVVSATKDATDAKPANAPTGPDDNDTEAKPANAPTGSAEV